jgi:penicillin amidase
MLAQHSALACAETDRMNRTLKTVLALAGATLVLATAAGAWYVHSKQPQRGGSLALTGLQARVEVRYDERGVPHIRAGSEADLYRALGYVQAQDRLFQMEMARRLARGELAEILGPKLLDVDRLFRTLGIRANADAYVQRIDTSSPAYQALLAYLDGVNQFQASHPAPLEFDVLGIARRPFTPQDTLAVAGYLAYSFATALRTEPAMTHIRDKLGPAYLKIFDLAWHADGVDNPGPVAALGQDDWHSLNHIAQVSQQVIDNRWAPPLEGSNAWALSGRRTASGKPLLAGDPHIGFSAPAVWYEAHLSAPGLELYGHFQPLNPLALLGHNQQFGWSLTMFQNDDMDLVAEKTNPANANQVWYQGRWVDLQTREETISVKGGAPQKLVLRRSPHGPVVTDAFRDSLGTTPVALWWALLETENPILDAFYALNRADTLDKARAAASQIHAPGLNVVWANAAGDIGWWAAARLPRRPDGVDPTFILDGSTPQADKPGFYPFTDNPQEENPARGYVVSANHQPRPTHGVAVPGYYHLPDRVQQINGHLRDDTVKWTTTNSQALQLDSQTGYGPRTVQALLPALRDVVTDPGEKVLLEQLAAWDGHHDVGLVAPTLFTQLQYSLAAVAMTDEMGAIQFRNLLGTRALDQALPRLAADASSPWWDDRGTPAVETRTDTLKKVWRHAVDHLGNTFGKDPSQWTWGRAHTLTHNHPLGQQKPLDRLFSIGPFAAPGGREIPNALGSSIGPAPWAVSYGPSTRRLIDFADASLSLGINPLGQSGVWFDTHYSDQARRYIAGTYVRQWLKPEDVAAHTRSTLVLAPAR